MTESTKHALRAPDLIIRAAVEMKGARLALFIQHQLAVLLIPSADLQLTPGSPKLSGCKGRNARWVKDGRLTAALSPTGCPPPPPEVLTHVELPHEAGHVVVLEVLWEHLLGELSLVEHMEAVSTLCKAK